MTNDESSGPLLSFHTPILVVGTHIVPGLRPLFTEIDYGPETVSYATTLGDARTSVRQHEPAILLLQMPIDHDACKVLIKEARKSNDLVRIITLGPECAECPEVEQSLPWPVAKLPFLEMLREQLWLNAVAQGGYRGHL
jgi:hypothetical protein